MATGPLDALCALPGSKSETNRALVLAALAEGPSRLTGLLHARDAELMRDALAALGVGFTTLPDDPDGSPVELVQPPAAFRPAAQGIDCGLAGTVMRFVPPIAALTPGTTDFFGDERAAERPMAPMLDGLRQLGVLVDSDQLPLSLTSPPQLGGPAVAINSSASSQFISALLLIGARLPHGLDLQHRGGMVPSLPHIQMTVQMLRDRGVAVTDDQPARWLVAPGPIAACDQRIEPDLTNAAVFLAAGVLSGGQVTVPGWPALTNQPGAQIRDVLAAMGAETELAGDRLTARAPQGLTGARLDLGQASELTPVVAALAVFADGTTTIGGVAHIRGHETDRLAAIRAELASIGVRVQETADGLEIHGVGASGQGLRPTRVLRAYADHRLAHLAALIGLVVPGIELDDIASVTKTMPDFTGRWAAMLTQPAGVDR